ncbi:amidohydrolase family protein [Undibacterium fentianense]|uniref:Amidohydrolase family protein n=1 Tax=Undibacterium fentianense TaxID=2828728 RepID=A0A941E7F5_9BURK|nr:amidohydrolase family protein [Undibacterium fentianense]MBR7800078.1 amidohydrolase family protein [Undibacterium fentianense]
MLPAQDAFKSLFMNIACISNFPHIVRMLGLGVALAGSVHQQAVASDNVPAAAQKQAIVFKGATLHPVTGPAIPNAVMLVERGRIVALGTDVAVPPNTRIVDVSGKHIYPGMIAANTVIGLAEVQSVRATLDYAEAGAINPNARALVAVNPDSELIATARANGVLAALSVPASPAGLITGTSALIQLDGWTWEDMSIQAELGLHITVPAMRFNPELYPAPFDSRLEEMRKLSVQRIKMLEEAFDAALAYREARAQNLAGKPEATKVDVRWEAMLPVLSGQRRVFFHAQDVNQIRFALNFAQRYQLKAIIVGGADAAELADNLKQQNVPVIITGIHKLPLRRGADYDVYYSLAAKLAKAGVSFCIARAGTDDDAPNERNLPYEAAVAAAFGLDPQEALKAITIYPAQILGVADKLGSLDAGKFANFFITDGDPLETMTNVEQVYIQGRKVDISTKQSRLTDKYRQKYLQKSQAE